MQIYSSQIKRTLHLATTSMFSIPTVDFHLFLQSSCCAKILLSITFTISLLQNVISSYGSHILWVTYLLCQPPSNPFSPRKYKVHSFPYSASDKQSKELYILNNKILCQNLLNSSQYKQVRIFVPLILIRSFIVCSGKNNYTKQEGELTPSFLS